MRMRSPRVFIRTFAAGVLTAAASIAGHAAIAAPVVASVTIQNFDFHPMALTVPIGATVKWKNLDGEPHTVTSADGSFRSGALDQDDTYDHTFTKPGVYTYLCSIHPRMVATITVK
ncbi:MAG TPA: cupredoxin domain-containing protein [Caulobacteraceae bacterium]|nr:cupredoxin domain-containing protein [Caulobacteraceae bacterium]